MIKPLGDEATKRQRQMGGKTETRDDVLQSRKAVVIFTRISNCCSKIFGVRLQVGLSFAVLMLGINGWAVDCYTRLQLSEGCGGVDEFEVVATRLKEGTVWTLVRVTGVKKGGWCVVALRR